MRIPETLMCCLKYELGVATFPFIKWKQVHSIRQWQNYSPEKRASHCKKISEYQLNKPKRAKKKLINAMKKGMRKYWKNLSESKKKVHIETMSKGMKKVWDKSDGNFKPYLNSVDTFRKRVQIEHDVPRINTYSGVITESEMKEISV